jgi:Tol biopolymer transport system component
MAIARQPGGIASVPARNSARAAVRHKEEGAVERSTLLTAVATIAAIAAAGTPAAAQLTERVSVDSNGAQGNGDSETSCLSRDGRFVVFESFASNLVANDTNGFLDVFVHDRLTGVTERVNVDSFGAQAVGGHSLVNRARSVSDDGRYVVFFSYATNLDPNDVNGVYDVFVHDRATGSTQVRSVSSSGVPGDDDSSEATISADGSCIAFTSEADNLVSGDSNQNRDVFVHDLATGATEVVSVDPTGNVGNGSSFDPWLSPDGRFVTFSSYASNLVPGDTNAQEDVFLHDRTTGVTEMIDVDSAGAPGIFGAYGGSLSADGRFVAFQTFSQNLLGPGVSGGQVLVRDRQSGTNTIVSVGSNGVPGDLDSPVSAMSADGRFVAFESRATNLVPDDTNGQTDVFLHDRLTGVTTRCNVTSSGDQCFGDNKHGGFPSISGDGRFVSFIGVGDDLVPNDTNGFWDTFVHGPYLTLEADPLQPAAGATLTLTTWTGQPSGPHLLAMVDVSGAATFVPAILDTFDPTGVWTFSAAVPPGLSGLELGFQSYGFVATGKVQASNVVEVAFQ